jgi:hypothetical protein
VDFHPVRQGTEHDVCFSTGECPMAIIIKLDVESVGLHPEELMWT